MSGNSQLILALAGLVREVNGLVQDKMDEKDKRIKELEEQLKEKKK